jgi:hypothetical protein
MEEEPKPTVVTAVGRAAGVSAVQGKAQGFRPLPDDHPCYALVGLITAEQARIESMLDAIIWELAEFEPAMAACITGQMIGMFPRYNALFQLAHHRRLDPSIAKEINYQAGKAGELGDLRNRAVHDPWFEEFTAGGSYQHKSRNKKNLTFGLQPVTTEDLKKDLSRLRSHMERVMKLRQDVWAALHP